MAAERWFLLTVRRTREGQHRQGKANLTDLQEKLDSVNVGTPYGFEVDLCPSLRMKRLKSIHGCGKWTADESLVVLSTAIAFGGSNRRVRKTRRTHSSGSVVNAPFRTAMTLRQIEAVRALALNEVERGSSLPVERIATVQRWMRDSTQMLMNAVDSRSKQPHILSEDTLCRR